MSGLVHRRGFLISGASLALAGTVRAAGNADAGVTAANIAEGVQLFQGAGCNVVAVSTSAGPVLIDGGLAANSRELLRQVQRGQKVQTLFNTHWHLENTGSNDALGRNGVRIIAHENTRLWMQRPIQVDWQKRRYPARPEQAWPTATFYTEESLQIGGRRFHYGHLGQAHTDGDIYVQLPDSNVLVAGDVVSVGTYPVSDWSTGGWIGGQLEAAKLLLQKADDQTLIVPGAGPVIRKAALQQQHDMLEVLRERIWQLMRKGMSDLDIVAAKPTQEYDAQWGDPGQFLLNAYKGIWGHVREMRGVV